MSSVVSHDQKWVFDVHKSEVFRLIHLAALLFFKVEVYLIFPQSCVSLWTLLPQLNASLCSAHGWILSGLSSWQSLDRLTGPSNDTKRTMMYQ
jgi:hypothetical protein